MDNLGAIIVLLSFVGFLIGIVGVIKGSIKFLKIYSRKKAALFILGCFVLSFVGGVMLDTGTQEASVVQTSEIEITQSNKENVIEASDKEESEEKVESKETLKEEQKADSIEVNENPQEANLPNEQSIVSGNLEVHFIDVGQADSILVKAPAGTMLIDAGNNTDSDLVTSYIKKQGIIKLDVVVGTHPHEDHIGGLDAVITAFDIEKVYMPKVAHTTQTFEDVLLAIQNKGLKITAPTPGATFDVGGAKCTILAPNSNSYDDLNNYSIVIKMEYGQTSFLFAGDAEDVSEKEMLNKKNDLSSHVLKVGHHGSDSSTTQAFLNAVNPKYAVIMVGKNNSYGHPTKTVLDRLKAKGVAVYRTDENGTIVATSDGSNIKFSTRPGTYSSSSGGSSGSIAPAAPAPEAKVSDTPVPTATDSDRIVYWTPGGKSYHYNKNCSTLSRSKNILEGPLSECPKNDPCDRCVR